MGDRSVFLAMLTYYARIAIDRDEGVTKLLFDDSPEAHGHGKILGGGTDLPPVRK